MADESGRLNRELRRLERNINNIARSNRFQIIALKTVEGLYKQRIFQDGRSTRAGSIGKYSTKKMLVGGSTFKNTIPGKAGEVFNDPKTKWVTLGKGRKRKRLAVIDGGYKKFRDILGRQSGKVDLSLMGDLERDIVVGKTAGGNNAMGFFTDKQYIIATAQEKRFKKEIFALSNTELKAMDRAIVREFDRVLRQSFR